MKKLMLALLMISMFESCFIFRRTPKTGCPTSGAAIGAEKILAGDQKAMKASRKAKFKGN